ncbi:hypothetical protein GJ496_004510 [Pomphorhynchus laevis]|nr:hypothetical protein GJ496_004510 [Pomphorhynchus laevis]
MNNGDYNNCMNTCNEEPCKIVKLAPGQQLCVTKTTYCLSPPPDRTEERKINPIVTVQCCPDDAGQEYIIQSDKHQNNCSNYNQNPYCPPNNSRDERMLNCYPRNADTRNGFGNNGRSPASKPSGWYDSCGEFNYRY